MLGTKPRDSERPTSVLKHRVSCPWFSLERWRIRRTSNIICLRSSVPLHISELGPWAETTFTYNHTTCKRQSRDTNQNIVMDRQAAFFFKKIKFGIFLHTHPQTQHRNTTTTLPERSGFSPQPVPCNTWWFLITVPAAFFPRSLPNCSGRLGGTCLRFL